MKLLPGPRVDLGEGALAFPHPPTVCLRADGSALAVVAQRAEDGWGTEVVHVDDSGERARVLLPEGEFGAQPVILDLGAQGVVVLADDRTAVFCDDELGSPRVVEVVDGPDAADRGEGLTAGGIARAAADGGFLVVLTDPVTFQNARTIARLLIDGDSATWTSVELLAGADFPMAGGRTSTAPGGAKAPIVGDVLEARGIRFVGVEGSDTMSLNRYGSDFFTVAELDSGGRVARRVYEESGWKKRAGKHGIRSRFTSDETSAILTPVFSTGDWKGRQRMLSLDDGALDEVPRIRGAAEFALVDVRDDRALLASSDELLFARVVG
ncbi:hypothetical protein [Microbacterium sp. SA39]|uniref:hypothetical protein n=1 Tax=Microbacterium sp. SA39 TaxID=1263625 RepID=UPI0005FA1286|nr:hypothetical protein [Microbacterium sp. SA39]KJQ52824.1 hypothetical protein RS85_03718 [Microbacterium sp. SA39]